MFGFSGVDAVRELQDSQRDGLRQMVDRHTAGCRIKCSIISVIYAEKEEK